VSPSGVIGGLSPKSVDPRGEERQHLCRPATLQRPGRCCAEVFRKAARDHYRTDTRIRSVGMGNCFRSGTVGKSAFLDCPNSSGLIFHIG